MKNKIIKILSFIIIAIIISSCGGTTREKSVFKPQKVIIPESLKGNQEVEEYFTAMSYAVDEFAYNVDEMVKDLIEIGFVEDEELNTMQKFKALKIFANYATTIGNFMLTFAELEEKSHIIIDGLTDDEKKAFEELFIRLEKRMQEIDKKYNKIIGE